MRCLRDPAWWACVVLVAGLALGFGLVSPWPIVVAIAVVIVVYGIEYIVADDE
jgi:hypothetical protein